MPTKKPVIQIVLTEKYSKSNQGARIIEKFIDEYEEKHGEINLDE